MLQENYPRCIATNSSTNKTHNLKISNISTNSTADKTSRSIKNVTKTIIFGANLDIDTDDESYDDEDYEDYDDYDDISTNINIEDEIPTTTIKAVESIDQPENNIKVEEDAENINEPDLSQSNNTTDTINEDVNNIRLIKGSNKEEIDDFIFLSGNNTANCSNDETNNLMLLKNISAPYIETTTEQTGSHKIFNISGNLQIKIKDNLNKLKTSLSTNTKHFQQSLLQRIFTVLNPWTQNLDYPSYQQNDFYEQSKPLFPRPLKDKWDRIVAQYNFHLNDGYFGQYTPPPPPFLLTKLNEKKQEILNSVGLGPNYDFPYPYRSLKLDNVTEENSSKIN